MGADISAVRQELAAQRAANSTGPKPKAAAKKVPAKKVAPRKAAAPSTTAKAPAKATKPTKSVAKSAPSTRKGPEMPTNKYSEAALATLNAEDPNVEEAKLVREAVKDFRLKGFDIRLILEQVPDEVRPYLPEFAGQFGSNGSAATPASTPDPTATPVGGTPVTGSTTAPSTTPVDDGPTLVDHVPPDATTDCGSSDRGRPSWVAEGSSVFVYVTVNGSEIYRVSRTLWGHDGYEAIKAIKELVPKSRGLSALLMKKVGGK